MFKSILVPVDGSESSDKAVALGADIASKYDARLHLINVLLYGHVPDSIRNLSDKPGGEQPAMAVGAGYVEASLPHEVLEDIADKLLERAKKTAEEHGASNVSTSWRGGSASNGILEQAKEVEADAIVMGSRGLSDLKGLVVGSVSHKVQHLFEGTVISVK
ncbi:universal stress protein [Halofilum ochraceum]|uniref:universal stress protein n=1 Tax=Halofilum ochraceum TaxID=1611323 RepID=UPI00082C5E06|nr:universal stress protein [Halofilum ochraceum]